jgi:hypothetical protein
VAGKSKSTAFQPNSQTGGVAMATNRARKERARPQRDAREGGDT